MEDKRAKAEARKKKEEEKKAKAAKKQAEKEAEYSTEFEEKKSAATGGADPTEQLSVLLKNPPLKSENDELKQATFMYILKAFNKVSSSKHDETMEALGEDLAINLLMYCFKAMELIHEKEEKVLAEVNMPKLLSYINVSFARFHASGIARTGFARGEVW